ncbi:gas vesicle protein GvpO [Carboxydochorda subterranea]|uniref:Gas vesicle protein GvpO n=1 Tax=Carboxydichorda subterranea TaxID=3109565 RepID=A0ABZ1BXY9_9FIRM|nr:gas vesicle protein GvpO [Limnochorda sp. L945t]WRP17416.1 gas vesicle protein GvpO [Limnochorda sp. L945t]
MPHLREVLNAAIKELKALTGLELSGVTGALSQPEGWLLQVELVERRGVPDTMDVLGLYEVHTDAQGHVLAFERKGLRHRGDVDPYATDVS